MKKKKNTMKVPPQENEEYVWIAYRNPYAKDMNKQPWYQICRRKVHHKTEKAVIFFNGKSYPIEQCYATEEECKAQFDSDYWYKERRWGE